jgi:hypothetical protein
MTLSTPPLPGSTKLCCRTFSVASLATDNIQNLKNIFRKLISGLFWTYLYDISVQHHPEKRKHVKKLMILKPRGFVTF